MDHVTHEQSWPQTVLCGSTALSTKDYPPLVHPLAAAMFELTRPVSARPVPAYFTSPCYSSEGGCVKYTLCLWQYANIDPPLGILGKCISDTIWKLYGNSAKKEE